MYGIATALLSILAFTARAATITIPSTTVLGTDVFSGPTFTLTSAVQPTDVLTLTASGQVFLQTAGTAYGTNPAGVVTTAGTTSVGGTSLNGTTNFGSLLLGNSTLGSSENSHPHSCPTCVFNNFLGSSENTLNLERRLGSA
jgi:hypothetical protein